MGKAAKINKAIDWITYAAGAYFVGTAIAGAIKKHREEKGANGIGYADTPNYSLSLLNRYIQSVPVTDVQVVLNDKNKYGHYYVLCGDVQGGRDFYLSGKNLPYFRAYCERRGIEYEEFYLPDDVISGIGAITATGNEKTTIRDAWKRKKETFGYVIFKDIAEPKESQVWRIDYYDPSYKEYVLYNCADTSKEKYLKGDKTCFTGFYF